MTAIHVRVCSRCYCVRAASEGYCPECRNPEFQAFTVTDDEQWICTFCGAVGTMDDFSDMFQDDREADQPRYFCQIGGCNARVITAFTLLPSMPIPNKAKRQKTLFLKGGES